MANPQQEVSYLSIAEAKKLAGRWRRVNLFAAISEIGTCRKSEGPDYVLTLKIVDQSYPTPGLTVSMFADTPSKLPDVSSGGDIVCLRGALMRVYNGEYFCSFNKQFGSFALFEGKSGVGLSPYQNSTTYQAADLDDEVLFQLRTWLLEHEIEAGLDDKSMLLKSITFGQVDDLVCKVLHSSGTAGDGMLFVWDGTDAPTLSLETDLDIEEEPPCTLCDEPPTLSREVVHAFPSVGTVLWIFNGDNRSKDLQRLQGDADQWVRICNVVFEMQSGMWKAKLRADSKVRQLSNKDTTVLRRERLYKDRTSSTLEHMFFVSTPWSSLTVTDDKNAAFSTLRISLANPEPRHKFKCVVRVIGARPWRTSKLCSSAGKYATIRLTLEDPTARIGAIIFSEDAAFFFGFNPMSDELPHKMNKLLGISNDGGGGGGGGGGSTSSSRNPPWVVLCLKSFYPRHNSVVSRQYRIYSTRLM